MLFLFSMFFFFVSFICFFLSIMFMDYGSLVFEILLPFSMLNEMPLSVTFDFVSLFFFSSVSLISGVVFLYSKFYMDVDYGMFFYLNSRFTYLLFLFVVSMFFLVFSSSWVMVMLGWDGLGLVSFLLVIFYNNSSSVDSGLITVFTNRLGDCFFIISFMFFFYSGFVSIDFLSLETCLVFSFFIMSGAITKSAQLPFSSWLPAAMAAPTPVSSLVHSSTLVTAGIYLLIRFNFLLESVFFLLTPISLFTMLMAGVCAVYELDFKKVVAMSTLSQLGFMVFSITCGYWMLSFLHMIFHAFFKSSLFLATGGLMHYLLGGQDSRDFGSLGFSFTSKLIFSVSSLSLMGFPFSLGFYSKDSIIGEILFNFSSFNSFIFFFSCCFTVSYSLRLLQMGFMNFPSFSSNSSFLEETFFYFPIIFIYTLCVFFGNFFFNSFLPPMVFSFYEFFFGVIIILLGIYFLKVVPYFYWLVNFFMSISFLSFFSSSFLSKMMPLFSFKGDYTWGEILGGGGFSLKVFFYSHFFIRLYSLKLSHILIILFLFVLLISVSFLSLFNFLIYSVF